LKEVLKKIPSFTGVNICQIAGALASEEFSKKLKILVEF
jgi:hypothetical protein